MHDEKNEFVAINLENEVKNKDISLEKLKLLIEKKADPYKLNSKAKNILDVYCSGENLKLEIIDVNKKIKK